MRFDHRLPLRVAPLLLAALAALTPQAHAQDSRRAGDPVTIRERVALPPADAAQPGAALDVVHGTPHVQELVAADGSRVRLVLTPTASASPAEQRGSARSPGQRSLLQLPTGLENHSGAAGAKSLGAKAILDPFRSDEHAPFSADPYGEDGACGPLTPFTFPTDGFLYFYQAGFQSAPSYTGSMTMTVYYNGVDIGSVPIATDPSAAPPIFWNTEVPAGATLHVRIVYEYQGQTYYGDLSNPTSFHLFDSYSTDGVWYGGLLSQIYHPTSPQGDYEFVFAAGFEARLRPALASFRVDADPDTLGLGAEAIVGIEPIDADSAVLRLPSTTELSLSLDGATGPSLEGEGFGLLRLEPTEPEGQDETERELPIVPLEAVCAERLSIWAAERLESEPPVLVSVRSPLTGTQKWVIQKKTPPARTDVQRELPPDVIAIDVELFPSDWGPGGQGEGEAVVATSAQVLRQNGAPIPTTGPDAYLMVSKVRPDWLLPTGAQPFSNTGYEGNTPFPNVGTASDGTHYDPDTYRLEVSGIPTAFAASELRIWLDLETTLGGPVPILERGHEGEDVLSRATYEVVCEDQGDETQTCRSKQFVRLVSNARPQIGAFTGAGGQYDDEKSGLQTIRAELLDKARVGVQALVQENNTDVIHNLGAPSQGLSVGQPPTFASDDAVREASLAWFTYADADGSRLPSAPGTITDRMSEDWAQASVQYTMSRPPVDVQAEDATNVVFLGLSERTRRAGSLRTVIDTDSGTRTVETSYEAGFPAASVATILSNDIRVASGGQVRVFIHSRKGGKSIEFILVMENADLVEASSSDDNVLLSSGEENLQLEEISIVHDSSPKLAPAQGRYDPF